jgi:hypothetical protein
MRNYHGVPNYFYYEECQFSHFPAIAELNKQIMTQTNNQNCMVIWLTYDLFKAHVPYCWDVNWYASDIKKYVYEDFGLRTIVIGSYAFIGYENTWRYSYHPTTLSQSQYNIQNGILSYPTSPTNYENWLQTHPDNPQRYSTIINFIL